jgi:hydroxymethylbilane synthase
MKLRIGTRGSDLALWQARHVASLLAVHGAQCELVVLQTRGDVIDDVPLTQVEGKAFFTAEIERALLAGEVDLAVHSHKDLPSEMTPGLTIAAVPERASCGERLLIAPGAHDERAAFLPLRRGARVGTSAPRRSEQLTTLRPDLDVLDLRGNVPTRVRKLRDGLYDAIVLAAAGLDRLQLAVDDLIAIDLPLELFVPAPAQGALAIQVRTTDTARIELVRRIHDEPTARAIAAERRLLALAGGGCNLPLGAVVAPASDAASTPRTDLRREGAPPPTAQTGGLGFGTPGVTRSPKSFRAHTFLGAQHPAGAAHGRWANATAATPEAAIAAAYEQLERGAPTDTGPLAPLSVALAGSAADGSVLGERLSALGARVVLERVIEFEALPGVELAREVASLRAGDVLAVTSRQIAPHLQACLAHGSIPAGVIVAAVGAASARALREVGVESQVVGHSSARELAAALDVARGARVLFPCAEDALHDLEREFAARGIEVRRLELYRTRARTDVALDERIDARVYMSPSAVQAALPWQREHMHARTQLFALGHTTAAVLAAAELAANQPSCSNGAVTDELIAALAHLRSRVTSSTTSP